MLSALPHPLVSLVSETGMLDRFTFPVSSTSQSGIAGGKRIVVSLLANGGWRCKSCASRPKCHHVDLSRAYAIDTGILDDDGALVPDLVSDIPVNDPSPVPSSVKQPVSFIPVLPPRWCRLPSDTLDYLFPTLRLSTSISSS